MERGAGRRMLDVGLIAMLTTISCPVEMPPRDAAGVVGEKPAGVISSPCSGALLRHRGKTGADLDALHRVDAHHRVGDLGVQPVRPARPSPAARRAVTTVIWRRPSRRTCAVRPCIPRAAARCRVRREEGLSIGALSEGESTIGPSWLIQPRIGDAIALLQPLARNRAGRDAHRRLARRRTAAAAVARSRTSACRRSRHGPGGRSRRCCRSPCCAGPGCGSTGRSACPVVLPSKTPERISTVSGSRRCVT